MGLAGNSRQNLDVKELRYQAIENMEVTGGTEQADLTVTASTMITDLICGDKVGCHRVGGKVKIEKPAPPPNGASGRIGHNGSARFGVLVGNSRLSRSEGFINKTDDYPDDHPLDEVKAQPVPERVSARCSGFD
jgi:hypothetical protein